MTAKKPVKGMFDMEKRLTAIEQKVEVIYNVSLMLDKWLKNQDRNKGVLETEDEEDPRVKELKILGGEADDGIQAAQDELAERAVKCGRRYSEILEAERWEDIAEWLIENEDLPASKPKKPKTQKEFYVVTALYPADPDEDQECVYLTAPAKCSGIRKYWSTDEKDALTFDNWSEASEAAERHADDKGVDHVTVESRKRK